MNFNFFRANKQKQQITILISTTCNDYEIDML